MGRSATAVGWGTVVELLCIDRFRVSVSNSPYPTFLTSVLTDPFTPLSTQNKTSVVCYYRRQITNNKLTTLLRPNVKHFKEQKKT